MAMSDPPNSPPPPEDDPLIGDYGSSKEGPARFVPEFVKKVAVAGLGALFMTEEGIRSLAGQLKLPKEMLGVILTQAEKTKDDVGRVVSEELRRFLQSDKLREEFLKLMAGMTLEIKAEVRLQPRKDSEPEAPLVVSELSARRHKKQKKE
ncbi:MAG: hypothetical protein ACT4TC_01690 [Myxococcaceae bacterium]